MGEITFLTRATPPENALQKILATQPVSLGAFESLTGPFGSPAGHLRALGPTRSPD